MTRLRWFVILVLLASGCGGGGHSHGGGGPASVTATDAPTASTSTPDRATGSAPSSPVTTATIAGHPATTSTPAATPTAPVPTVKGPVNKAGSGPVAAAPGGYRYRQTGSATVGSSTKQIPPEGSLKIDPVGADGNQVSHRTIDPNGPPSDTTFAFRAGGVFLVQTVQRTNAGGQQSSFTCTFSPPMASPPWPPRVGATYGGHADCGQFTVDVTGQVSGQKDVTLDNTARHTYVLSSKLTFHGQLEGTGTQTDWLDPATSLVLHEESSGNGKYGGVITFAAQSTSDLVSARPQ